MLNGKINETFVKNVPVRGHPIGPGQSPYLLLLVGPRPGLPFAAAVLLLEYVL